jgi:L-iditol 2-dehydrogenase
LAARLGADRTIHSDDEEPEAAIRALTDDRGADIVFECAGGESMPETLPLATRLVRRGGKVVIVGGFDAGDIAIPLEWQRIQMSEITLIPSASFAFHDIHAEQVEVLDLVARGALQTQALITHRFPLDQINEAFEVAQDRGRTGAIFVGLTI